MAALVLQTESHRGGRSEPAGVRGLRKQVTEAKAGSSEKAKRHILGKKRGRMAWHAEREREKTSCLKGRLKGFYLLSKGGNFRGDLRGGSP